MGYDECVGFVYLCQCCLYCFFEVVLVCFFDQVGDYFRVGVVFEGVVVCEQFFFEWQVVFDDVVVYQYDVFVFGGVGVVVVVVGQIVGGLVGVFDVKVVVQWCGL